MYSVLVWWVWKCSPKSTVTAVEQGCFCHKATMKATVAQGKNNILAGKIILNLLCISNIDHVNALVIKLHLFVYFYKEKL